MTYTPVFRVELVRERRLEVASRKVHTPEAAAKILYSYYNGMDREVLAVMGFTTKQVLIGIQTASVGTIDCSLVHPREVFKPALLMNAASVIVAHNHPSGDPEPSPEDCAVTRRLLCAAEALGIDLLDHIVVGDGSFVSLRQRGLWNGQPLGPEASGRHVRGDFTAGEGLDYRKRRTPSPSIREPLLVFISPGDESYRHVAQDGTVRVWDVTVGNAIARSGHELMRFPLAWHGVTPEKVLELYDGIEVEHAMGTDLTKPLLFIPFFGESLLVDGWHRLYKAACHGVAELPMYLLTQEEADIVEWLELPGSAAGTGP
jgi:DNA repair protein RadC